MISDFEGLREVKETISEIKRIKAKWRSRSSNDISLFEPLPDWREIVEDIEILIKESEKLLTIANEENSRSVQVGFDDGYERGRDDGFEAGYSEAEDEFKPKDSI